MIAAGTELQRSTDGGRTWRTSMNGIGREWASFHDIVFTGSRWLAITELELFASDDDGVTWSALSVPGTAAQGANAAPGWRRMAWRQGTTYLASRSLVLESRDEGRTWAATSGATPFPDVDRLVVTKGGLWVHANGGPAGFVTGLQKGTRKWQSPKILASYAQRDYAVALGAAGDVLCVMLTKSMLVSRDEGKTWRLVEYTGDALRGTFQVVGEVPDAILVTDEASELYRVTPAGVTTRVHDGPVRALAAGGNRVVALTTTRVIESQDGGRSFTEERTSGIGSDWVDRVSASGKDIAVVAMGPTAHVSDDRGRTWHPGPELGYASEGLVAGKHAFLFHTRSSRDSWLWRATSVAGPWARVPLPASVTHSLELLGADGSTIAIAIEGTGYLTTDVGQHWTSLGPSPQRITRSGLVRANEVFTAGFTGMARSHDSSPFEDVTAHFAPFETREPPDVVAFFHEDGATFAIARAGLYAWDRARDHSADLTSRLPIGSRRGWLDDCAVDGRRIVVSTREHLFLSPDFGASWVEREPPLPDIAIGPLAHSDAGFLVGQYGLWAEGSE